jgi:hypothetical protein
MKNVVLNIKCWLYTRLLYHYLKRNDKEGVDKILAKKINLIKSVTNENSMD